jgi:CheY-like chemotaxis protein
MLSHELCNPLGALAAAAQVLRHVSSKEAKVEHEWRVSGRLAQHDVALDLAPAWVQADEARRSLMAALKLDGHDVYAAPDGRSGLAAVAATNPEVAVIDIGLPGLDGYQVAQSIRGMPSRDSMVLIALTGYGQPDAVRRARDAGFDEHVLKPIAPDQLVRLIDVACAAKAKRAGGRPSA